MVNETREEMAEIEVEDPILNAGFCPIPMVLVADENLSAGAMITYGVICFFHYRYHGFPGQRAISELTGVSLRSIREHISMLVEHGYIETVRCGMGKPSKIVVKSLHNKTTLTDPRGRFCTTERQYLPINQEANRINGEAGVRPTYISERDSDRNDRTPSASFDAVADSSAVEDGEKKARAMTPTQQAIQDAYEAFPLEGVATDPPGGRKRYSGLARVIQEKGLPLVREWTEWLLDNPQEIPEGSTGWAYFCESFVRAMRREFEWKEKSNGRGYPQGSRGGSSPLVKRTNDGKYQVPEGLLSPEGKQDALFCEYYAKVGPCPEDTEFDSMATSKWHEQWWLYQQRAGRDLPMRGGMNMGRRPSEMGEVGSDEWNRAIML